MERKRNPNALSAGESKAVEPIRNPDDIERIRQILANKPRDLAIFTIGIGMNIRVVDLVRLQVGHFRGKKAGESFELRDSETSRPRRFVIPQNVIVVVNKLLRTLPKNIPDDYPLFASQRAESPVPLTTIHLHKMVSQWCWTINLKGNFGSLTLRKTWFLTQKNAGVPVSVLERLLAQTVTLNRFLCLPDLPISDCDAQRSKLGNNHNHIPLFC